MPETRHIAIVGPSGSGKSWLAQRITAALGPDAGYLSLDDFYLDLSSVPVPERNATNFDDPAAIDWPAVQSVLDALSEGKTAAMPCYDFATHTRTSAPRNVTPREWMIWDGLWLLHTPWLRERFASSVFIDCTATLRFERRLARDVAERGRTALSVRQQFEDHVEPMRQRFVDPQRQWAVRTVCSPVDKKCLDSLVQQIRATARPAPTPSSP